MKRKTKSSTQPSLGLGTTGKKWDSGKLRYDLLPMDVIDDVVDILTYGAEKYDANNWQQVEHFRYNGAIMRHLSAYLQGEMIDPESKRTHIAHVLANAVFLAWKDKHADDL